MLGNSFVATIFLLVATCCVLEKGPCTAVVARTTGERQACKPVTLVMTRATGTSADYVDNKWKLPQELESVNLASVQGALKYVISEAIDVETGATNNTSTGRCYRKNNVNYIQFFNVTVCNSNEALWWFNKRRENYGGDPNKHQFGEFGQFLTFDEGQCHGNDYCDYLTGHNNQPNLRPFVGWLDVSTDPRNPTVGAYWYSLPGSCTMSKWNEKSAECKASHPSGKCQKGQVPNGLDCTWQYELLGQVTLDDLVGITSMHNPRTKSNFKSYDEFCRAGYVEFQRSLTYRYVDGLEFWKDPLNQEKNGWRIHKLKDAYAKDDRNYPIPKPDQLRAENPPCYQSLPGCYARGKDMCNRDQEMVCVKCKEDVPGDCRKLSMKEQELRFPTSLKRVVLPNSQKPAASSATSITLWEVISTIVIVIHTQMNF